MTDAEIAQSKRDHAYQRAWNRAGVRWGTPTRWSNAYYQDAQLRLVYDYGEHQTITFTNPWRKR